jgi:hypothetical protein
MSRKIQRAIRERMAKGETYEAARAAVMAARGAKPRGERPALVAVAK